MNDENRCKACDEKIMPYEPFNYVHTNCIILKRDYRHVVEEHNDLENDYEELEGKVEELEKDIEKHEEKIEKLECNYDELIISLKEYIDDTKVLSKKALRKILENAD